MRQQLVWLPLAAALTLVGTAVADETPAPPLHPGHGQVGTMQEYDPGQFVLVRGRAERAALRMHRWVVGLDGARAGVFQELGVPNSRHFELTANRRTEVWTYLEPAGSPNTYHLTGTTFVFSGNDLVQVRRF